MQIFTTTKIASVKQLRYYKYKKSECMFCIFFSLILFFSRRIGCWQTGCRARTIRFWLSWNSRSAANPERASHFSSTYSPLLKIRDFNYNILLIEYWLIDNCYYLYFISTIVLHPSVARRVAALAYSIST